MGSVYSAQEGINRHESSRVKVHEDDVKIDWCMESFQCIDGRLEVSHGGCNT